MKLTQLIVSLFALMALSASAQTEAKRQIARAALTADESTEQIYLVEATKGSIQYISARIPFERAATMDNSKINKLSRVKVDHLYLYEPKAYTQAMDLFQARKYKEALKAFENVSVRQSNTAVLENNYSTLAQYYQIECCRRMLDLDGMKKKIAKFDSAPLTRQTQIAQLELFAFWEAVLNKEWQRLDTLCKQWTKRKLPVSHRAQIEFCHAQALEGLKQWKPALNAYARAMTADFTTSHEIVKQSALNALAIYAQMDGVKREMKNWGKPAANSNSEGYQFLGEAYGLASIYEKAKLGGETSLPAEYKAFLKFQPPHLAKAKEKAKEQAKKEAAAN